MDKETQTRALCEFHDSVCLLAMKSKRRRKRNLQLNIVEVLSCFEVASSTRGIEYAV